MMMAQAIFFVFQKDSWLKEKAKADGNVTVIALTPHFLISVSNTARLTASKTIELG
jgi:hypothetical protein